MSADFRGDLVTKAIFALATDDVTFGVPIDGNLDNLDWQGGTRPTDEAITAKMTELNHEMACDKIRQQRAEKLKETDWWAVSDRTMTQAEIDYRQALRDMTTTQSGAAIDMTTGALTGVTWPTKP